MVPLQGLADNRLLTSLPSADFGLLSPYLQKTALEKATVLHRSGDRIKQVYFPHSGAVSFMLDMSSGQTIATAIIGREGIVGVLPEMGSCYSSVTAIVSVAMTASRISASRFHAAFLQSRAIRHMVQIHTAALLTQFQHLAACNALYPVKARTARWLLCIRDRTDSNAIPLTQEALSQLLGVTRTTVNLVLRELRASGAVRSVQRGLIEIDGPRLEEAACECYKVMRSQIDGIVLSDSGASRVTCTPKRTIRDAAGRVAGK
jgi:CRP-like cAMP-binding protein